MHEDLMEQKYVGSAEFNLAEAVYARHSTKNHGWLKKKLENIRRTERLSSHCKFVVHLIWVKVDLRESGLFDTKSEQHRTISATTRVARKPRDPPIGKLFVYAEESVDAKVATGQRWVRGGSVAPGKHGTGECTTYNLERRVYKFAELQLRMQLVATWAGPWHLRS